MFEWNLPQFKQFNELVGQIFIIIFILLYKNNITVLSNLFFFIFVLKFQNWISGRKWRDGWLDFRCKPVMSKAKWEMSPSSACLVTVVPVRGSLP